MVGTAVSAQEFPRYVLRAGKADRDGNPFDALSSAKLCVVAPAKRCFTLPAEHDKEFTNYFYMDPKAIKTISASGEELVLFDAHTMGGSGYAYEYALLRYSNHKLTNLLPVIRVSNISDRALWNVPEISPLPIFLTADFLWEDGAHYGDHRYTVRAYRYDTATAKYIQIVSYETVRTYPSAEWPGMVHVLKAERGPIEGLLRRGRVAKR